MRKILILAAATALALPLAANAARTGEEIFNSKCTVCHTAGVAGAPKFGNADDWGPRAAKGIDALLESAKNGLNAMPPRGTCMDCSDEELKSAIEYMLKDANVLDKAEPKK